VRFHHLARLLTSTAVDDGWLDLVLDLTRARASRLKLLHDVQRPGVSDFAEDDVLAIQPGGDDGGDEELGAVGVGICVGHGQQSRFGVSSLKVLIRKLLAVDGLAAGAISTSEVTTLQHELRDDTMEGGALVAESLLTGAESTEVLGGLGDYIVVEVEVDPAVVRRRYWLASAFGISSLLVEGRIGPLDIKPGGDSHGCW